MRTLAATSASAAGNPGEAALWAAAAALVCASLFLGVLLIGTGAGAS
ncbi:hypothetical protein [Mesoterricola sediminis]|uniref:Uncharacterized protein n=1 Tax=Mesoterricola sediminis TaxID=2927980 RepID=A0AA48KF27_9BACT|nr:hypothetical protein [Mesoterricola sediminis]BDU76028.1 hypothetical protein METESE_09860 [Mesoterricola sediminis]